MRVSQQVSVALAIGPAAAWVLPFPIPTITIPQLPTGLPTFTIPGFTNPLPQTTSTKTTSVATSSSSKAATTGSPAKSSTSSFGSARPSSFVSGGSVVSSPKSSVVVTSSSTSRPTSSSLPPVVGQPTPGRSTPVGSGSGSSSAVKPSGSASSPAGVTSTLPSPYLPPGQTGTLQSPTCVNSTSSIKTSTQSVVSSPKSSASPVSSAKPSGGVSSSGKVPTGGPSTSAKGSTGSVGASSSGKVPSSPVSSAKTTGASASGSGKVSSSSSKASGAGSSPSATSKISSSSAKIVSSASGSNSVTTKPVVSSSSSSAVKPSTTTRAAVSSIAASSSVSRRASSIVSSLGSVKPSPAGGPSTYVNTTSGRLQCGTASNVTGVTQCLGIPFAQPPVGNLRFAAPVAYTSDKVIDATKYGADCPATLENVPEALGPRLYGLLGSLGQVGDTLAEDCLFLNVWMKNTTSTAKKPVLVWIYGGGFEFGGSAVDVYSGKYFAQDEDVVFVSLNYRVNILGFSGAPNQTQNIGLLDQRMAVEWVRDNIAAFGGDADRITIFGQSAGGASTDLYRYAWTEDPIIAGSIPMSGTATAFAIRNADQGAQSWYTATTAVGCGNSTTSTDPAILACMRNASIDSIVKAAAPSPGLGSLLGSFGPVVDGQTVFASYPDLDANGSFIRKPVLLGNVNYESGLFILIAAGAGESYPQSFWDYVNTQVFTCPVTRTATAAANFVPTWRYYYSGMYPNELIPTANISQAWHTAELPVLFGTTEEIERNAGATVAESANTQPQADLAKYIRHAWVTFATDPTSGLSGSEFGWPQYSASGDNVVFLGQNNETVAYGPSSDITAPCS